MNERGQFTFYASIFEAASHIRSKASRADFYDAVCHYALNGILPNMDALSDAAAVGFISVKPNLDASRRKAKSGSKGGKSKQGESKPKQGASEKEEEKENECYSGEPPAFEDVAGSFAVFWNAYPKPIGKDMTWLAWQTINPDKAVSEQIMVSLAAWKRSGQWTEDGDRFIPKPAKWLSEGYWKMHPAPAKTSKKDIPKGASGILGDAEMEAIRNVLVTEM